MSIYTIDSTIIVTSTTVDTSVSVSLAGLSQGVYTVKVASVDYANRTGSYSNVLNFELKGLIIKLILLYVISCIFCLIVPPAPDIVVQSNTHESTITLLLIVSVFSLDSL